jgi:hypothetical protein
MSSNRFAIDLIIPVSSLVLVIRLSSVCHFKSGALSPRQFRSILAR